MALQIKTITTEPTSTTLILEGQLDATTAPSLDQVCATLTADIKTLVLDLGKLTFVSSAGLRIFAKIRKLISSHGGSTLFVNPSPQVQKVFDIVKAVPLSEVFRSTDELDAYLATMQQRVTEAHQG